MLKLPSLAVAVGLAALSIIGATSANAQSATSCPGGSDKNASDCLQIFDSTHTQLSEIATPNRTNWIFQATSGI